MVDNRIDRVKQMKEIQQKCLSVFEKKNHDYGDAFAKYGLIGILVRMEDKINRAITLDKNNVSLVNEESMRDTLLDLHNYAAMGLMLMDEDKTK